MRISSEQKGGRGGSWAVTSAVAAARSGSVGGMGCLVFGRAIAGFRF